MQLTRCLRYNSVLAGLLKINTSMNFIKKLITPVFLLLIALIIIFPRFYQLGDTPHGLHIDEVSFAADAKSLAETGKDTWGVTMPRVFKAFGEYKAPGLTYSMAFWAKVTGDMNNYVARLPSAFAGLTMIVMLVLTLKTLVPSISPILLATVAFMLAYSPWHFDMSRIFYEAFSATAWLSISIYFATRLLLPSKKSSKYDWLLMLSTASIAGYYYASLRYVIIIYALIVSYLLETRFKAILKRSVIALLVLTLVGVGWVGDLFSDVGLNRLYYYQQKADFGSALEIDEKRQFCYLALDRDSEATRGCYLLWNKPVSRITGIIATTLTYLGTDFLFIKGVSEYGFDSQYGAYLPPLVLIYLIGLYYALTSFVRFMTSRLKKEDNLQINREDRVFVLYLGLTLLSLVPAAVAMNLNMRMAMVSLYIISILIGYGIYQLNEYLVRTVKPTIQILSYCLLGGAFLFYAFQSTIHYWFVFTKSNDLQWTSDAGSIFHYVKSVSNSYDRIVDTELHGPLAPYFYGDITTAEVHHGEYSKPDAIGFTYLIMAGKYELNHINIKDLACEVVSKNDKRRTLLITNPYPELVSMRKYESRSWNGALLLHEVYDLADVIAYMQRSEPNFMSRCGPK